MERVWMNGIDRKTNDECFNKIFSPFIGNKK